MKKELLDLDKVPDKKYDWNQEHFKSVQADFKSIISDESIMREGDMEENTEIPFSFWNNIIYISKIIYAK